MAYFHHPQNVFLSSILLMSFLLLPPSHFSLQYKIQKVNMVGKGENWAKKFGLLIDGMTKMYEMIMHWYILCGLSSHTVSFPKASLVF